MRPRSLLSTAALALAAAALAGPSPAAATTGRCAHHAGAVTLAPRALVTVYRTPGPENGARIYACYRPTGRTLLLHTNTGGAAVTDVIFDRHVAVHGRVVAFHVSASGDRNYDLVRSFDVPTGRRLRTSPDVVRSGVLPLAALPTAIATNAAGDIEWLANGTLSLTDRHGTGPIAAAQNGPVTHLSVSATKAHWTQGGSDHRARLR